MLRGGINLWQKEEMGSAIHSIKFQTFLASSQKRIKVRRHLKKKKSVTKHLRSVAKIMDYLKKCYIPVISFETQGLNWSLIWSGSRFSAN